MVGLTGQSADLSIAYAMESGAARIGRLILNSEIDGQILSLV
jgi:hypothetical protein